MRTEPAPDAAASNRIRIISFYNPDAPEPLPLPPAKPAASPAAAAGSGEEEEEEKRSEAEVAAAAVAARQRQALYSAIKTRLEARPVWPAAALVAGLAGEGGEEGADEGQPDNADVAAVLAALVYQFKTGGASGRRRRRGRPPLGPVFVVAGLQSRPSARCLCRAFTLSPGLPPARLGGAPRPPARRLRLRMEHVQRPAAFARPSYLCQRRPL
jgi:hypothetical protein